MAHGETGHYPGEKCTLARARNYFTSLTTFAQGTLRVIGGSGAALAGTAVTDLAGIMRATPPVAVVGLACRFPDSDDPAALLDTVLTGRQSFRRLPPGRIDLGDYYQPDRATSDATYSTRAAVLEGWRFEGRAFGIEDADYIAADPAHWLALETAARALAAAGLPAGTGLDRDRTGVIIGNTLAGDISRANALRVRWPYVRQVITDALSSEDIPEGQAGMVLRRAESSYLAPFPTIGPYSFAGSLPSTIAAGISSYFGFRGGSHAVDSRLLLVAAGGGVAPAPPWLTVTWTPRSPAAWT